MHDLWVRVRTHARPWVRVRTHARPWVRVRTHVRAHRHIASLSRASNHVWADIALRHIASQGCRCRSWPRSRSTSTLPRGRRSRLNQALKCSPTLASTTTAPTPDRRCTLTTRPPSPSCRRRFVKPVPVWPLPHSPDHQVAFALRPDGGFSLALSLGVGGVRSGLGGKGGVRVPPPPHARTWGAPPPSEWCLRREERAPLPWVSASRV
jgi:hypothetical protein